MGMGLFKPGCNCCDTCDGSITVDTCFLTWTTNGAYEVELRYDDGTDIVVISENQTGTLNDPSSGTYSLWVRCSAGGEFVEVDSVVYTQPAPGTCEPCCEALGYDTTGLSVPIVITLTGDEIFGAFNGTYVLTGGGTSEECSFSGGASFDGLDTTDCGTVDLGDTCTFNSSLFANAFFLGTRVYTHPSLPGASYDLYGFPDEIQITYSPSDNTITILITISVWGFLTSSSNGTDVPCCISFGSPPFPACSWNMIGYLAACGATSACGEPPVGEPCSLIDPALYEGYDISGTFASPDLTSYCANVIR